MRYFSPLATIFCLALFFSCTSDVEMPPPPLSQDELDKLNSSSSGSPASVDSSTKYCVYYDIKECFPGSLPPCPAGGILSDVCPQFPEPSSGSGSIEQSSSGGEAMPEYGYCVFVGDKACLSGTLTHCPTGGTLSNECPYSSGSGAANGSSSSVSIAGLSSSSNTPSIPDLPDIPDIDISGPQPTRYDLAAFIYDTDASVHPDFSCGVYLSEGVCSETPTVNSSKHGTNWKCTGVTKGLAKTTLNKETKKIECGNCTKNDCWSSADWFSRAFTSTPGVNVQLCYDMPFTQAANGRYEFDSDAMTQDGTPSGRLVGGFFPKILNDAPNNGGDYSNCSACATKRVAEIFAPINEKTWDRDAYMSYQSKEGDFANGDSAPKDAWDWGARDKLNWYLWGSTAMKGSEKGKANELFCFESHAQFIYDPEQEFYFTGDDDIWVYVNDTLVVDLGGAHLAAPGHIKLKDIKGKYAMTAGEVYDIDIFFCDRRTTQSNVRISTNMYVMQKSSFWSDKTYSKVEQPLCAALIVNDCASKMGMGSGGLSSCGQALIDAGLKVELYLVPRGGNTADGLWLLPNAPGCTGSANNITCYGGIKVVNAKYSCGGYAQCQNNGDATAKVNLSGDYNVYARLIDPQGNVVGSPILVDRIKSESGTFYE